jgi:membrane protein
VSATPTARLGRAIVDGVDAAGGGLLAAGLAFQVLFAILPALLLLAGLTGYLVEDPQLRAAIVREAIAVVPPLAQAIGETLRGLAENRAPVSIIAVVGLLWGASNLYASLDESVSRIIPGETARSGLERRIRGLVAVVALILAAAVAVGIGAGVGFVERLLPFGAAGAGAYRVAAFLATAGVLVVAVMLVYRIVPTRPPSWRAALVPAVVAGLVIAAITDLYALLAPFLVGALQAFGLFAALFAALVWLNYVCQVLLLGASWARVRRDAEVARAAGAAPAGTAGGEASGAGSG